MRLSPEYPVRSARLLLRPVRPSDVEAMHAYRSIPDVSRWVPFTPMSRADIAERIAGGWSGTELTDEGQALTLAVVLASTGELIGDVVLFWHSREHAGGEVGYVLNPDFGGHGYATEAVRAVLGLGFEELGLHRIVARIDTRNAASAALAVRLEMRQEAHLVRNEWFKGEWSDEFGFAMLADEWRAVRRTQVAPAPDEEEHVLEHSEAFSGFSVDNLDTARQFYGETLGLTVSVANELMQLHLAGGRDVLVYPKDTHVPATFTVLNFPVDEIEQVVRDLAGRGVVFERYPDIPADELGIARGGSGPAIAWFTDPAGNILSVLQGP